jgi:8-oxo-dGTP diphosphatase
MDANIKKRVGVGFGTILLRNGKILLGKRHDDPEKADSEMHGEGTWTIPGGKLDFGEGLEEGAYRETLEETGIKLNKEKIKLVSLSNDRVTDAHFITLGFLCEEFEGEPQVMEPDEITEWQWFDLDNLPSPIFFPTAKVIKNYLAKIIYTSEK